MDATELGNIEPILQIRDLRTYFDTDDGVIPAVDGISFSVSKGEKVGVVGESGCGKSVMSLSIMRLVPCPPGRYASGEIIFEGEDLLKKTKSQMRNIRGNKVSRIFQEPMTSLNPVLTIGYQIIEAIRFHQQVGVSEAKKRTLELLKMVGIPFPEGRIQDYPHQMSGGMRQRVMIAMALACRPKLLIADEPTTALDVTIQAQILDLMRKLNEELGMAIILITHDLGVVAEVAEKVVVMYTGKVVEAGDIVKIFKEPYHPYTKGLIRSIPSLTKDRERLEIIAGGVPNPTSMPKGCRFHPRCPYATPICSREEPPFRQIQFGHDASCWLKSARF